MDDFGLVFTLTTLAGSLDSTVTKNTKNVKSRMRTPDEIESILFYILKSLTFKFLCEW